MRVLVTRAQVDAPRTAARLAARGHDAIVAPITEIVPTQEPPPAEPWDAFVLTSAHAVAALAVLACDERPVFTVGSRTAEMVREAGFPHVRSANGDSESLASLIRTSMEPPARLLHVAGRHRKAEPETSLRKAGYAVLIWETYEARQAGSLPRAAADALRAGQVDAALHYSRRSADLFLQLAEEAGLTSILRTFPHLCLSRDVARPFEELGLKTAIASRPREDALLALLDGEPLRS